MVGWMVADDRQLVGFLLFWFVENGVGKAKEKMELMILKAIAGMVYSHSMIECKI